MDHVSGARNGTVTRVRERRGADCFQERLKTYGSILKRVPYVTDAGCFDLCIATEGYVLHTYAK